MLKKEAIKKLELIAEDEFLYLPSLRYEHLYKDTRAVVSHDADEAWAKSCVFSMRFAYLADKNLLAIFGVPTALRECFDSTIYFQNSCDQDYEFEEWKDVPVFAEIAERWKNATDDEVRHHYWEERRDWDEDADEIPLDYYRRTFAYDEVWGMVEDYMWNDDEALHLALFGYYDLANIHKFVSACRAKADTWREV